MSMLSEDPIEGGWAAERLTSGGRLAGIDVADNDDVDVSLLVLTVEQ